MQNIQRQILQYSPALTLSFSFTYVLSVCLCVLEIARTATEGNISTLLYMTKPFSKWNISATNYILASTPTAADSAKIIISEGNIAVLTTMITIGRFIELLGTYFDGIVLFYIGCFGIIKLRQNSKKDDDADAKALKANKQDLKSVIKDTVIQTLQSVNAGTSQANQSIMSGSEHYYDGQMLNSNNQFEIQNQNQINQITQHRSLSSQRQSINPLVAGTVSNVVAAAATAKARYSNRIANQASAPHTRSKGPVQQISNIVNEEVQNGADYVEGADHANGAHSDKNE